MGHVRLELAQSVQGLTTVCSRYSWYSLSSSSPARTRPGLRTGRRTEAGGARRSAARRAARVTAASKAAALVHGGRDSYLSSAVPHFSTSSSAVAIQQKAAKRRRRCSDYPGGRSSPVARSAPGIRPGQVPGRDPRLRSRPGSNGHRSRRRDPRRRGGPAIRWPKQSPRPARIRSHVGGREPAPTWAADPSRQSTDPASCTVPSSDRTQQPTAPMVGSDGGTSTSASMLPGSTRLSSLRRHAGWATGRRLRPDCTRHQIPD